MQALLWLLLPVAAASGWWMAQRKREPLSVLSRDYFKGLNYLVNEQPDKAIECFVRMAEVDNDTVEVHLALGNLFRQRGEVDRAIRIHQNLVARPTLSKPQRSQALLELAQDYMRAGLFDRAEGLCQELVDMEARTSQALILLTDIYEQEKEWELAIATARRREEVTGESLHQLIAHFHCEMAEQAKTRGDKEETQRLLKNALSVDPGCVRATIMRAELAAADKDCKKAIRAYRQVEEQDPAYLTEIIPALVKCYRQQSEENDLLQYLEQVQMRHGGATALLAAADIIGHQQGVAAASEYLQARLRLRPSLRGLAGLLAMKGEDQHRDTLTLLRDTLKQLLEEKPVYQCTHCGFSGKVLYWHCPGCKRWNTVKPISGVEGD